MDDTTETLARMLRCLETPRFSDWAARRIVLGTVRELIRRRGEAEGVVTLHEATTKAMEQIEHKRPAAR